MSYSLYTRVASNGTTYYWTVSSNGNILLTTAQPTGSALEWNVSNGVLFNQGRQVYYDVNLSRFTLTRPIETQSYASPCMFRIVTGNSSSWVALVTTAYPLRAATNPTSSAAFDTSIVRTPSTYTLPVIAQVDSIEQLGSNYPALGATLVPAATPNYITQLEMRIGTTVTNVDLTGFVPLSGMGTIAAVPTVKVGGDQVVIPEADSNRWLWIGIAIGILVIVVITVIVLLWRPKTVVIPIAEDPLFRTLVATGTYR